jgi:hypothetical protein
MMENQGKGDLRQFLMFLVSFFDFFKKRKILFIIMGNFNHRVHEGTTECNKDIISSSALRLFA